MMLTIMFVLLVWIPTVIIAYKMGSVKQIPISYKRGLSDGSKALLEVLGEKKIISETNKERYMEVVSRDD